jgi:leukotriene A-4 hydrolase/aminopeptidase
MSIRHSLALGIWALFVQTAHAAVVVDRHSYANTDAFKATHVALDLHADFERKRLSGHADLTLERLQPQAREVILDTRALNISSVELLGAQPQKLQFKIGSPDQILGAPLRIELPAQSTEKQIKLRVKYETSPQASGLQWLTPAQTASKRHPFLFSQSQAIHARSWIPLQDTPSVRLTYEAHIRTPPQLLAVMSAANDPNTARDGDYQFNMPQAVPSYLIALGVGDLVFKPIGKRTGVYADPAQLSAAANEFADTEAMLTTCEKLFGPYQWGRYDLLILPPSFMWGGMENPRLSFITPTVIAGDRSLVSLIAHELAHSWSGNLVTNATWESVWLNEGFTTYLERRIIEVVYGPERSAMEDTLGFQSLQRDLASLKKGGDEGLTKLAVDLQGRDPDDAFSDIAYEKGRFFVGFLESRLGRDRLDQFLRGYFSKFAFHSATTEDFRAYLKEHVLDQPGAKITAAEVNAWIDEPGLPSTVTVPKSNAFQLVDTARKDWLEGRKTPAQLDTAKWTTHQWLHFLDNMPSDIASSQLKQLDDTFHFTGSTNSEIAHSWFKNTIRADYAPAYPALEKYLSSLGRRKLVRDLYEDLAKTTTGKQRAQAIYRKARPLYQVPLAEQLDELLGKPA